MCIGYHIYNHILYESPAVSQYSSVVCCCDLHSVDLVSEQGDYASLHVCTTYSRGFLAFLGRCLLQ